MKPTFPSAAPLMYTNAVKMPLRISTFVLAACLLLPFGGFSQTATSTATQSSTEHKRTTRHGRSAEEIAEAKTKGLVWVNSATRVYHKEGPLYGTTRLGKFMTEEDAKKAGYRLASHENGNGNGNVSGETKQD